MCLSDGSCSELNQGSKHYLHVLTSSFRICKRCYSPSIRVQQVSMEINIDPNTWVQFGGGHGGHNMLCPPPLFSLFIWRGFKNKSDVCHVLCEELFMLDGRPHIVKVMLKQSLV